MTWARLKVGALLLFSIFVSIPGIGELFPSISSRMRVTIIPAVIYTQKADLLVKRYKKKHAGKNSSIFELERSAKN